MSAERTGARRLRRALLGAAPVLALLVVVALAGALALVLAGRLPEGPETDLVLPVVVALAVAALVFGPLRRAIDRAATRALRGERLLPEQAVQRFGDRATRGLPLDELLRQLAESLRLTLDLAQAEVWLSAGPRLELAMAVPATERDPITIDPGEAEALTRTPTAGRAWLRLWAPSLLAGRTERPLRVVPAVHGGAVLGLVVVERPAGGDAFGDPDDRALAELGRRLGVVLHNRELDATLQATMEDLRRANAELRASRARLVVAADQERRRIERDIHDGAQQHLVALAVNVRLARDAVSDDPEAAKEILDGLGADVRATVEEVRALAHGIYPPLLVDGGLAPALRAAAQRSPLPVTVVVDDGATERPPAEVEAAVYFCCLEALQNAAKHSPGAPTEVRLSTASVDGGPELHFSVTDEGPGFDPERIRPGHGLQNMADRIGAVGGTITWTSSPCAGTRIAGTVPVPR